MRLTKKGTTNLVPILNYSQAFGQIAPEQPFDLLRKYPTDMILLRISKINAIIYIEDDIMVQNIRVLKEVIFDDLPEMNGTLIQLTSMIERSQQGIFSGPVMSVIIKECLENYLPAPQGKIINAVNFAGDLFKAILAYNEWFYAGVEKYSMETFTGLFKMDIQQQYYLRKERYLKLQTLLKFAFISKFLSEDKKLKGPVLEYCRALEIGTVWGLAQFFLHIFTLLLSGNKEAKYILDKKGAKWPVLEQFVVHKDDLIMESPLSLHKDIVPKPLYEIDDQHLILLDYNYFTYGLDQGLLFSIFNKSSLHDGKTFKNYNEYKAYIGLVYFENYFIGRFIKTIFSKWNNRVVHTEKYQDYIVKAGNNVFVFEVKMTEFNANGLDKESFNEFKEFIDKNFLSYKQDGKGKAKGLSQIVRQIEYLAQEEELKKELGINNTDRITVYPIIIYSDASLDMHGVNEYVNEKFDEHIRPFTGVFQSIRPVVMINGAFFMTYYYLLRKDPATFGKFLNDYFKSISNLKKRYKEDKGPFHYLLYNKSFADHMRRKVPKEDFDLNLTVVSANFELNVNDFGKDIS